MELQINDLLNKRAIDITAGELAKAVVHELSLINKDTRRVEPLPAVLRGVEGIASLLGCTKRTALKFTSDKRFESAIKKEGNMVIVDTEKFLSIYGVKKGGRRY